MNNSCSLAGLRRGVGQDIIKIRGTDGLRIREKKKDGAGGCVVGRNTISGQLLFLPEPPPPRIGLKSINTPWTDLGGSGQLDRIRNGLCGKIWAILASSVVSRVYRRAPFATATASCCNGDPDGNCDAGCYPPDLFGECSLPQFLDFNILHLA